MHKLIGLALIKEYILENSPILVGDFTACEIPVSSLFPGVTHICNYVLKPKDRTLKGRILAVFDLREAELRLLESTTGSHRIY